MVKFSGIEYKDVFISGSEGYHTYRIPGMITTQKGTILIFAEGRSSKSDHAENDIVLKRSNNNGESWEPLELILSNGKDSLNNPVAVEIEPFPNSNRILLMFQRTPYPINEWHIGEGYEGDNISHTFVMHSDDEGFTWSKPRRITKQIKRPTVATSTAVGPGFGIVLKYGEYKGRIIMPFNQGPRSKWKCYAVYSNDNGETWQYGELAKKPGNEVQMVELANGDIMLNARNYWGKLPILPFLKKNKYRVVGYSRDGGVTWENMRIDTELIEPNCAASIIRYSFPQEDSDNKDRIIFSNPASQKFRNNGMIRISYDEAKTWKYSKVICKGRFAYSCLTILQDKTIGCVYETGEKDTYEKLVFARFSLDWLTDGQD